MSEIPEEPAAQLPSSASAAYALGWRHGWVSAMDKHHGTPCEQIRHTHDLVAARNAALEEAAKVADEWQNETGTDIAAAARICPEIAAAIRALAEKE